MTNAEKAANIAAMIIDWIDSGAQDQQGNWREGLPRIIELRLNRPQCRDADTGEFIAPEDQKS